MIFADGMSLVAGTLSYINVSLHSWNNLFDMTVDLVKMLWNSCTDFSKPLRIVSVVFAFVMMGLFLKISLLNEGGLLHKVTSAVKKKHESSKILGDEKHQETEIHAKRNEMKKGQ